MTISITLPAEERICLSTQNHEYTSPKSVCFLCPSQPSKHWTRFVPSLTLEKSIGFLLSCLYFFLQLSPYSFPYSLRVYCLSIFIVTFIPLGEMTVCLPPDQMHYWSLCTSSTVPSPRKCVTFPNKDNTQCIPFPIPLTLFPLGICSEAGCQVVTGGPEVVPAGLLTGCSCSVQPCHLSSAGAYDSNVKNIWWGLWENLRTVCVPCAGKSCMLLRSGSQLCIYLLGFPSLPPTLQLPAY